MTSLPHAFRRLAVTLALVVVSSPAGAQVSWTDWTASVPNQQVTGTVLFGSTPVGVTYSGPYSFAQLGCGTNYWAPNVYTGGTVTTPPPNCEIIALGTGGPKTITFSSPVVNPLLALVSWNGQPTVTFNGPLQLVAQGCGFWGCGSIAVSGNNLSTSGEAHGTIRLLGTYSSITFTDASEGWHGITVGAQGLATSAVPEPSTYVLMATGLAALGAIARRRRS